MGHNCFEKIAGALYCQKHSPAPKILEIFAETVNAEVGYLVLASTKNITDNGHSEYKGHILRYYYKYLKGKIVNYRVFYLLQQIQQLY